MNTFRGTAQIYVDGKPEAIVDDLGIVVAHGWEDAFELAAFSARDKSGPCKTMAITLDLQPEKLEL